MKRKYLEDDKLSGVLFWTLWVTYAVVYMTKNCYSAAMAEIVSVGAMTKSQTGLITAIFYLVYAPLQILGGYLADRYKPEKLIIIGLIGAGLANTVIALNQNYYVMLAAWTLNGIAQFGLWPAVFKIISSQLSEDYRKKGAFYISFSGTVGLLMAYGVAAMVDKWQDNFLLSAVFLFVCTIIFGLVYARISGQMVVVGRWEKRDSEQAEHVKEIRYVENPFWESGFYLFVVAGFLCYIVSQGVKTVSPTMLMESYKNISPSIANSMNMIIILSGILGTILVKLVLYPKYIKNELLSYLGATVISLPFVCILAFIGKVDMLVCLTALAITSTITSATALFSSYFNMRFAKLGREGEAAGITNMAQSFGVVVQSYGLAAIADHFGWNKVSLLWIVMVVSMIGLLIVMLPIWKKFDEKYKLY